MDRGLVATFREAAHEAWLPTHIEASTLARDATALASWREVGFEDLRVVLSG